MHIQQSTLPIFSMLIVIEFALGVYKKYFYIFIIFFWAYIYLSKSSALDNMSMCEIDGKAEHGLLGQIVKFWDVTRREYACKA